MTEDEREAVRMAMEYAKNSRNMWLQAPNGARLSLATGTSLYSVPRDGKGPYTHVEVGFPSGNIPESWREYAEGAWDSETGENLDWRLSDIYGYMPVELLADWFLANAAPRKDDDNA